LVPAAIIFLVLQKPWKGRALPNSQVLLHYIFNYKIIASKAIFVLIMI
jgi:hypothetical protein